MGSENGGLHGIPSMEECFYGSATMGERGQIVVPADARKNCGIHPGDKLLVFRHPLNPGMLIIAKVGEMQQLLQQMSRALETANRQLAEAIDEENA
jgi:AbrB family looped-hinge helix DNA binding protein